MRLDLYINQTYPAITRSQAKRLIEAGCVTVGGVACRKPSYNLKKDDVVETNIPPPTPSLAEAEDIPLDVIFEDKDIIVINKPAGLVVHPAAGNEKGTLVNALLHHCKDLSGIGGEARPGIVHRLDKGTSGVMVVAKNDAAHAALSAQFKARGVEKRYVALVYGKVPKDEGTINIAIGRHATDRKRMSTKTRHGRTAETHYKVARRFGNDLTYVDIRLGTGRTHQIRVHFAHLGHPLVGDELYGGRLPPLKKGGIWDILKGLSRPFLHAYRLGFRHPVSGEMVQFEAPLPGDLQGLLCQIS